jgi:hypothetical protein
VAHTRTQILLFISFGLSGCNGGDGGDYVFLPDLCPTYAEDVCGARAHFCDEGLDTDQCTRAVVAECTGIVDALAQTSGLFYDAGDAGDLRGKLLAQLGRGEDPFRIHRFFSGALPAGEVCSDDLACSSGLCELASEDDTEGVCAADANIALCEDP